jgi:hypothetical protein
MSLEGWKLLSVIDVNGGGSLDDTAALSFPRRENVPGASAKGLII